MSRPTRDRITRSRLAAYAVVASWAGSAGLAQWAAVLRGDGHAVAVSSLVLAALLIGLALMVWHDSRRGRFGTRSDDR